MRVVFLCPRCERPNIIQFDQAAPGISCAECDWTRSATGTEVTDRGPDRCLTCGCDDLWRQKDFPQRVGLTFVGLGILFSSIAWAYTRPVLSIGILMLFALSDLVLYAFMPDVLVCYRCGTKYRDVTIDDQHSRFDLETAERYRQEAIRLNNS